MTGPDGVIQQHIPVHAENGSLTVGQYSWTLAIAHLNPLDDVDDDGVSGIQGRLRNMGYDPGPIDGIMGPLTKSAIKDSRRITPRSQWTASVDPSPALAWSKSTVAEDDASSFHLQHPYNCRRLPSPRERRR